MNPLFLCLLTILFFQRVHAQHQLPDSLLKYDINPTQDTFPSNVKIQAHQRLLEHGEATGNIDLMAKSLLKLGVEQYLLGDYPLALSYYNKADSTAARGKDPKIKADILLKKGNLYFRMENDATSLAYFEQYLQDVKKMGDSAEIAKAYTSIGNVLSRQGEEDAAVRNYLSSIKIFEALNRADLALIPKGNLSISLLHKNEPEKAIPYIEDVLAADKASGNQLNIAHSYTQLGQAWTQMKGYQKALSFFDEALEIIVPMKAKEPLYLLYSHRSDTYAAMGDFRSALADFRLSHAIKDSLMGEKSQQEIAALKIKFDKERELQQSKNEVETLKNQAKTKRLQYLSALFGLLLMLVMAAKFWGDRRRDKKIHTMQASLLQNQLESEKSQSQQLHQQLMLNHQDLTDLALEIARKNATLNDLLLKLERLEKANSPKMNEEIKVLKSFALSQSQLDKEKEMLHQNIDSINNEFYQKLEHRFGPLTPNEKELCGLIRLKLSNKDIAALKAISANSAKIARYRLRKRLGLEPNEDIVAFLQGI